MICITAIGQLVTTHVAISYVFNYSIYRGIGHFNFKSRKQSFKLQEDKTTSSIKCFITIHQEGAQVSKEKQCVMLEQRQSLLTHLKESINDIHTTYIPSASYPIAYIECPLSHEEACMPHVRLENISETEDVYCPKSDGKIVPPQAYMMLLRISTGECS